ncbi:MAG: hypothetical protein KY469_10760 [Actinobacteria bacterium]|nr:hypothetical protein [Actinomycetota bacterium]
MPELPLLATIDDLQRRVGQIDPDSVDRAESLLAYASSLVRADANRRWETDPPEELVEVVVGMVERARDNPAGLTQDTVGPFSVSYGPEAAQRVYLTKGDRAIIRSAAGGGAFTVPQRTGPAGWHGGRSSW